MNAPKKVSIIGNGGGGKTTLAKIISRHYQLPLTHVDSIQYLPGQKIRNREETDHILRKKAAQEKWLIDGFGSLKVIQERFDSSDLIIFIDFPLWRHQWWAFKRQIKSY